MSTVIRRSAKQPKKTYVPPQRRKEQTTQPPQLLCECAKCSRIWIVDRWVSTVTDDHGNVKSAMIPVNQQTLPQCVCGYPMIIQKGTFGWDPVTSKKKEAA